MAVQGYQLISFEWAMAALAGIFVALRLYIRIINRRDRDRSCFGFQWVDFWVLMAWFNFLSQNAFDTALHSLGSFKEDYVPTDSQSVLINEIYYVEDALYLNTMYCVKCAMLCFFSVIIPPGMQKTRIAWWITVAFVATTWVAGLLLSFLWCKPVWRNWTPNEVEACYNLNSPVVIGVTIGSHLASDVMIYLLPFPVLRTVMLPFRQKIGVAITFASGFVCLFFACALLASSYITVSTPVVYCFSTMEQTWAILVACLPAFKMLARDTTSRKSITIASSSHRQWTSGTTGRRVSTLRSNTRTHRTGRQNDSVAETSLFSSPSMTFHEKETVGETVPAGMGTRTMVEGGGNIDMDVEMATAMGIGLAHSGYTPSFSAEDDQSTDEREGVTDGDHIQVGWGNIDGTKLTVVDVTTEHMPQQPSPLLPPLPIYERRL